MKAGQDGAKLTVPAGALIRVLRGIAGTRHLCLEEGTHASWLYEVLSPHVEEVVVAGVSENPPCHSPCNPAEDDEDLEATMAAAAIGDRATLLECAAAASRWIAFNEERQSLVVLGCDKTGLATHTGFSTLAILN